MIATIDSKSKANKVPPYPRPVSPLHADPLPIHDVYNICYEDTSDAEIDEDTEERIAKRRRIEKIGEAHLRGEKLFIVTAALKGGPRGLEGWANPWLKKRHRKAERINGVEIPETVHAKKQGRVVKEENIEVKVNLLLAGQTWLKSTEMDIPTRSSHREESPTPAPRILRERLQHVEQMRMKVNVVNGGHPNPGKRLRDHGSNLSKPEAHMSIEPSRIVNSAHRYSEENCHVKQVNLEGALETSLCNASTPSRQDILEAALAAACISPKPREEPPTNSTPAAVVQSPRRNKTQRHGLDSEINQEHLHHEFVSPGNPQRQIREVNLKNILETQVDASAIDNPAAITKQASNDRSVNISSKMALGATQMHAPATSTQTSSKSIENRLPSAQVVAIALPAPPESSHSTESKLIEPLPEIHSIQKASTVHAVTTPEDLRETSSVFNRDALPHKPFTKSAITPFSAFRSPVLSGRTNQVDTQDMLATITPLGFGPINNPPHVSARNRSPETASRPKAKKNPKHASFAPALEAPSSRHLSKNSIDKCLKVTKLLKDGDIEVKRKLDENRNLSLFGKLGLDMETSDEEDKIREPEKRPSLFSRVPAEQQQKQNSDGGMVSSAPVAFTRVSDTLRSTTSGSKQDAQREDRALALKTSEQRLLEEENEFDISSAIDDLGSFLGSWDVEKAANDLASSGGVVKKTTLRKKLAFA